jgi:DNA-3-methyladenine glycosylase
VRRFAHPLPRRFYARDTVEVARALLGQLLIRKVGTEWRVGRIVETEAYVAHDPASHAYGGPTLRNRSMFGVPGTLYVYRIHQVHCANVVTGRGEAVLLRAAEPVTPSTPSPQGPGRLCRAFALDRTNDGEDLVDGSVRILAVARVERVVSGARVGISRARRRRLRFAEYGNRWVSGPKPWRSPRRDGRST